MRRAGWRWTCVGFESCCYYSGGVFTVRASAYPPRCFGNECNGIRSGVGGREGFCTLINSQFSIRARWILQGISQGRRRVIVDVNDGFFFGFFSPARGNSKYLRG